jgi:hypothetical protein
MDQTCIYGRKKVLMRLAAMSRSESPESPSPLPEMFVAARDSSIFFRVNSLLAWTPSFPRAHSSSDGDHADSICSRG